MLYDDFFRITATTYQNVYIMAVGDPDPFAMEYRTDGNDEWTPYDVNDSIELAGEGSWVEFRNTSGTFSKDQDNYYLIMDELETPFSVSGNLKSLISYEFEHAGIPAWAFCRLFEETSVEDCQNLMLGCEDMNMQYGCYYGMFRNCSLVASMPQFVSEQGAVVVAGDYAMRDMFAGCTALRDRPERPYFFVVETYNSFPCAGMFNGCRNISDVSWMTIQFTGYGDYSCHQMFADCENLVAAPELQGEPSFWGCYKMFEYCTSLTTAPALPATEEAKKGCYSYMFKGCTALTEQPELPATTLQEYCYAGMFANTRIVHPKPLIATALAPYCYSDMFRDNPALADFPEMRAEIMAPNCCRYMVVNCGGLKNAVIDLTRVRQLAQSCFHEMTTYTSFKEMRMPDCPYIQDAYKGICSWGGGGDLYWPYAEKPASLFNSLYPKNRTFYYSDKNLDVASIPRSTAGIPADWTIQYMAPKPSLVFSINGRNAASLTINGKAVAKLN